MTKSINEFNFHTGSLDVNINEERSPLMVAMQRTTSSLAKCFKGELRKINYPVLK